jgi:drug/metabolite transporter (DMT)-like permease
MVQHQSLNLSPKQQQHSPWPYMVRTTALVTCALTIAGGSWYVAVDLTTASDLTAIYNCSAFFAYAFSIPLLRERVRLSKVVAVGIAIAGVLVVAYGGESAAKHGGKSGGGAGGPDHQPKANYRFLGNIIIGIGSVLYGFYEVLYKKVACPPEDTSPGRGMIFANAFGSMIGLFTLTVLWIPLPILNWLGWETFVLPTGKQASILLVSVLANASKSIVAVCPYFIVLTKMAVFSGSFLVLISLTSPVLSSVAALLTIFLVAIIDQLLPPPLNNPLTTAAVFGGSLIIFAFLLLSWSTYKEMGEEKRRRYSIGHEPESDIETEQEDY